MNYLILSMAQMLQVSPWCRLPLKIQWLDLKFSADWMMKLQFPRHMEVHYGSVEARKIGWVSKQLQKNKLQEENIECMSDLNNRCFICKDEIVDEKDRVECVYKCCQCITHIFCLAKLFRKNDKKILPINGICPSCQNIVLWGDIVRKKIGCCVNID